MHLKRAAAACVAAALLCFAQNIPTAAHLGFEDHQGWNLQPESAASFGQQTVHGGRWSLRVSRPSGMTEEHAGAARIIPVQFGGKTIELRGFVRTENLTGTAALLMRQDTDPAGDLPKGRAMGTTDWTQQKVTLAVNPEARMLYIIFIVSGTGTAWADDLELLVDGKPIQDAPKREVPKTILDTDHEFDKSSGVELKELSKAQIENLVMLGKVWGFLKYHHPKVTSGQVHWDYELFRVLPSVLAADNAAGAIEKWIAELGDVPLCDRCSTLSGDDLHLRPRLDWVERNPTLLNIYRNRPAGGSQFYVGQNPGVGNPRFEREIDYKTLDSGFQLLALYRLWNIIEYWFPYRDLIGSDWDVVLREFVPRIALARDRQAYQLELMAFTARINDTHANLWSSLEVRPPAGACNFAAPVRFVEGAPVVAASAGGLERGDVIETLDGKPITALVKEWTPLYAASNEPTRLRDIGRFMGRGPCQEAAVRVRRGGQPLEVKAARTADKPKSPPTHDREGEAFQKLSDDVAYLKLSGVTLSGLAKYIDQAQGTKGLVIDLRNYPSAFVVFALGSMLVDKSTEFARFTVPVLAQPGAFKWTEPLRLEPKTPRYTGKVAILVDEVTQSSAEYHAMAFRTAPGAVVIGSTTAGADGNISPILLPGGLRTMISGIGVFYPDKRPTQRVGIVPDIVVAPSIAGIREGRDEVLERAIEVITKAPSRP